MRLKGVLKKFAAPVLAGMVILGGIAGLTVANSLATTQDQATHKQQVEEESPKYKGSIFLGQEDRKDQEDQKGQKSDENQREDEGKDNESEAQENAALAGKAKITKDEAIKAAETAQPGYTAEEAGVENENGYLIYGVEMSDQSGKALEVKVDAGDGKVLAVENDSEENEDK